MWKVWLGLVVLVSTACAYHSPTAPTPPPPDLTTPSALVVSAAPGVGPAGGTATITAIVSNGVGAPLSSVPVSFSTDIGTVTPERAATNDRGVATVTMTGPAGAAKVTAHAGSLTSSTLVALQPGSSPAPPITDPPPNPPPPVSTVPFTVQLLVTAAMAGSPTTFALSVSAGITSAVWDCGDGSPAITTTSPTTSHVYAAGSYIASVVVRDALGRTASAQAPVVIVNPPTAPTPPPPSSVLTASLAASASTVLAGSTLTFTATVTNLNALETVTVYQWDLDGSGSYESTTVGNTQTSAPYATQGPVTAKVLVTTSAARTVTATASVFVTAAPVLTVTLAATPQTVVMGSPIAFTATVSNLAAGETAIAYQWDVDGATGYEWTTAGNTYTSPPYATPGAYTAKVLVGTSTGRTVTGTVGIFVTN